MKILLVSLVSLVAAGCTTTSEKVADTAVGRGETTPRANQQDSTTPRVVGSSADAWLAGGQGAGPVRVGMTAAEARAALRLPGSTSPAAQGCSYLAGAANTRLHANVMLTNDTVVRIDVVDTVLMTSERARVGSTEAQVQRAYAGRVAVQPHKYTTGGHYLVVTEPRDANNRIVFETDGRVVTRYRVGRVPEVENVEGCG